MRRPIYIDADEFGDQGKQTTAIQVRHLGQQADMWHTAQRNACLLTTSLLFTSISELQLQDALGNLLDRYGVDVAIAGHHHRCEPVDGLLPSVAAAACRHTQPGWTAPDSCCCSPPRLPACPLAPRSYQRTCSVHNGTCHPGRTRGTVHLCVGNAGADFYDNGFQQRPAWVEHEVGAGAGRWQATVAVAVC